MIDIPVRPQRVEILFGPFMDNLEKLCGWNHRDMAGKYKWQQDTRKRLSAEHNIDFTVWSHKAPSTMTTEELKFLELYNNEMAKSPDYQDAWHWLVDNAFREVSNGSSQHLNVDYIEDDIIEDLEIPDYVVTVLRAIFDAVPEDHPARDYDGINFYISW